MFIKKKIRQLFCPHTWREHFGDFSYRAEREARFGKRPLICIRCGKVVYVSHGSEPVSFEA
jgi:hypothetical protein